MVTHTKTFVTTELKKNNQFYLRVSFQKKTQKISTNIPEHEFRKRSEDSGYLSFERKISTKNFDEAYITLGKIFLH